MAEIKAHKAIERQENRHTDIADCTTRDMQHNSKNIYSLANQHSVEYAQSFEKYALFSKPNGHFLLI